MIDLITSPSGNRSMISRMPKGHKGKVALTFQSGISSYAQLRRFHVSEYKQKYCSIINKPSSNVCFLVLHTNAKNDKLLCVYSMVWVRSNYSSSFYDKSCKTLVKWICIFTKLLIFFIFPNKTCIVDTLIICNDPIFFE